MCFGTLDTERRIVGKPSDFDCMSDQHTKHFEDRQRRAGPIGIGLHHVGNDTCASYSYTVRCPCSVRSISIRDAYPVLVVARSPT